MTMKTQITLNSELHVRAHARAAALGISLAEYMRRLIDRDLAESPQNIDRSIVFDLGTSGASDVTSEKDRMIGEATSAEKFRERVKRRFGFWKGRVNPDDATFNDSFLFDPLPQEELASRPLRPDADSPGTSAQPRSHLD